MKKATVFLVLCALVFTSCYTIKTSAGGKDNEAFMEFVGNPKAFAGGVSVDLDGKIKFTAEVSETRTVNRLGGVIYSIPTGSHSVTVRYNNKVIFQEKIFISTQDTRVIKL